MINVNARAYETSAIIRPIVLPHECRCLALLNKIKMSFLLQKENQFTYLSIAVCIAGLSPKADGRENKLDDMIN